MSKVFITGCGGMLGNAIYPCFTELYPEGILATDKVQSEQWLGKLDVRDHNRLAEFFQKFKPDIVLHLAAETDLEFCETNPKIAEDTNTKAQKQQQKDKALEGFSKEDAETIGKTFDKFDSVGGTFEENMQMAIEKVLPGQGENLLKDAINSPGGAHPNKPNKKEPSSELKSFGADKFGLKEEDYENANK